MAVTKTKLVTYDDYLKLPDDDKQYQIIGGELLGGAVATFQSRLFEGVTVDTEEVFNFT